MSTTIIPAEAAGVWELTPVTLGAAQDLVRRHEFTSAVGHASTAEVMTELLGQSVEANRLTVVAKPDDHFLCFKLKQRPPEGAVLDRAQLEALGFDWCVMHYVEAREEGPPAEAYKIGSWDDFPGYIRWGQPPARRA